jgi:hypothetical protein
MEWKNVCAVLMITIVVIGFGMEAYKKNIRGDGLGKTKAGKKEIVLVAAIFSLVFSCSFGMGLGFPGLPWAFPGYWLGVFLLQWSIDQAIIKKIWKALGLAGKTLLRKKGISDKDLEVLDE